MKLSSAPILDDVMPHYEMSLKQWSKKASCCCCRKSRCGFFLIV